MELQSTVRLRVDTSHLPLIGGDLKEKVVEREGNLMSTWRQFLTSQLGLNLERTFKKK